MPDDVPPFPIVFVEEDEPRTAVIILEELLSLVTSQHNQRPRYMATVALSVRPYAEGQLSALSLIGLFDLDTAVGEQLDFTGQWIGLTRFIETELDVWFTLDRAGLGFDEGVWQTPYEAATNTTRLDDESYRTLLKARVVANHWDGTLPGAYDTWATLFAGTGYQVVLQDGLPHANPQTHSNMKIIQALLGPRLDAVTYALFTGGYLQIKSAGVGIIFMTQFQGAPDDPRSGIGKPLFGFDADPPDPAGVYPPTTVAGFDLGAWGVTSTTPIPPPPPSLP